MGQKLARTSWLQGGARNEKRSNGTLASIVRHSGHEMASNSDSYVNHNQALSSSSM